MQNQLFEIFIFHRDLKTSCQLLEAGSSAILIDLERRGKQQRQKGFDTEINTQSIDDLHRLRTKTDQNIMCRLSGPDATDTEILSVIEHGANEIIIPMINTSEEVERIIKVANGNCKITVMIETLDGVRYANLLSQMQIERIYVGLNDLHIQRGTASIFEPLSDGLLDTIKQKCGDVKFGFGGLTLPNFGTPLDVKHLYAEMARVNCSFAFLRRSFYRDVAEKNFSKEIKNIRTMMRDMQNRSSEQVQNDHRKMLKAIKLAFPDVA